MVGHKISRRFPEVLIRSAEPRGMTYFDTAEPELLVKSVLLADDRRCSLMYWLNLVKWLGLSGATAEFGAWHGFTSRWLALNNGNRTHFVFESFVGLADADQGNGDVLRTGQFALSAEEASAARQRINLPNIRLVEGYFPDSLTEEAKEASYSFVHVDCDTKKSAENALDFFWSRLQSGGVILFDDYDGPFCGGLTQAVDAFFADKPEQVIYSASIQAAVQKF